MPTRKPLAPTRATLIQMGRAADAFVSILSADPRAQAQYHAWRARHGGTTVAALSSVLTHKGRDLELLEQFVQHELRLPYAWLPELLLQAFGYSLAVEFSLAPPGRLSLVPDVPPEIPAGRAPKKDRRLDHDLIERDIEWFYRAEVQEVRETHYALAKEDQARKRAVGVHVDVNPNVPKAGIARAKQLLAALEVERHTI